MKKEYDFSKGARGKFYKANAKLQMPIYLSAKNLIFIEKIAKGKRSDLSTVVNSLIESDIAVAKALQ